MVMADRRRQRRPSNPYQGLGILIAFALIIVFIASFWQVIIGCLIGAFVVYVVWRFREEICQGIAAFFRFIIRLFSGAYHRIHDAFVVSCYTYIIEHPLHLAVHSFDDGFAT